MSSTGVMHVTGLNYYDLAVYSPLNFCLVVSMPLIYYNCKHKLQVSGLSYIAVCLHKLRLLAGASPVALRGTEYK